MPNKLCFSACVCGEIFERWRSDSRFRVLVCGIETHVCVMQTALDLVAAGFEPYVAVDAVGARHAVDHETALRRMESAGVDSHDDRDGDVRMVPHGGHCRSSRQISALAKEKPP